MEEEFTAPEAPEDGFDGDAVNAKLSDADFDVEELSGEEQE